MPYDREQRQKVTEMLRQGTTRRIHLAVLSVLIVSGICLQGAVFWHAAQTARESWGDAGLQVWAFFIGIWVLVVVIFLVLLWKLLKSVAEEQPA